MARYHATNIPSNPVRFCVSRAIDIHADNSSPFRLPPLGIAYGIAFIAQSRCAESACPLRNRPEDLVTSRSWRDRVKARTLKEMLPTGCSECFSGAQQQVFEPALAETGRLLDSCNGLRSRLIKVHTGPAAIDGGQLLIWSAREDGYEQYQYRRGARSL
jgi:hypothetical protein